MQRRAAKVPTVFFLSPSSLEASDGSKCPQGRARRDLRSTRHVARDRIHKLNVFSGVWNRGPVRALRLAARWHYWVLHDGWANTMGLFLAQRENTAFSVMKRWALRGARSCARYI